jgi:ABC-type transport system involved in multi-copper enzyme maturation permease subunit
MYRTLVIVRHTFREAVVQPIYGLLLGLGAAILIIFGVLPFFTLGEDTVMFMSVGLDVILLLVLIATLFATSKSIFDEIEDRTMLTLMSKPVARWEVLVGKYLGIVLSALLAVAALGAVLALAVYWRIPGDNLINTKTIDDRELQNLHGLRVLALAGLFPALIMVWLQISTLAAIGVALSTRFSLVVNLPVVIFLYIAGNLTRFLFPLTSSQGSVSPFQRQGVFIKAIAAAVRAVLPYLEAFDLKARMIHNKIAVAQFVSDPGAIPLSAIWGYVALALVYAAAYTIFALSVGMWLFQTRELGGAEG